MGWNQLDSETQALPHSYRRYSYLLVDVFTDVRFSGSPLAVFTDARGLGTECMQRMARELNLSETTFVFPAVSPEHDFSVRIFSPQAELPTGGHPTIGTAFAIGRGRGEEPGRMVFDEPDGPVSVSMMSPVTTTRQALPTFGACYMERHTAAAILSLHADDLVGGLPLQAVSSSIPYLLIPIASAQALSKIRFRQDIWERTIRHFEAPHLYAFSMQTDDPASSAKARAFTPALGVTEMAASESACGPLVAYLLEHGLVSPASEAFMIFEQGAEIGRPSSIHVTAAYNEGRLSEIRVGGQCVVVGEGALFV